MFSRLQSVIRKEFIHIFRDPRTLAFLFLIPVLQLFLLGYAANIDVEHVKTAALDLDRSNNSRNLLKAFESSNYFDIVAYPETREELQHMMDYGEVRAGVVIPADFGKDMDRNASPQVEVVIDGSDSLVASTAFVSGQIVAEKFSIKSLEKAFHVSLTDIGLDVRPSVWYNPEMRSPNFLVPGMVGLILQLLAMTMTTLAIVKEREQGTIEQLIVTPIRPAELMLGKMVPYGLIVLIDVLMMMTLAGTLFAVPVHGSLILLLGLIGLAMISSLLLGLLISTIADNSREAILMIFFIMLPSIFLADYIFPVESMPWTLQIISLFIPLRYLLHIMRGIVLKGVGIAPLTNDIIILSAFGLVFLALASARFHKKLE